ncbi:hypothetical protein Taro_024870, partial [Colocasia esculenta]|nr:hypothetical protein [Colocasia esculenta]
WTHWEFSENVNKWRRSPSKPINGKSIRKSQSMTKIPGTTRKRQKMTERPGSCRLHGPVEQDPRRFYETTCALLGPAYGRPLQVLGLLNNVNMSRNGRKPREVKIRPKSPGRIPLEVPSSGSCSVSVLRTLYSVRAP